MNELNHVMIDIESFSLKEHAFIVSIGAVRFGTHKMGETLYLPCFERQKGRSIDLDTVVWWLQQSDQAREVFKTEPKDVLELRTALLELSEFINPGDNIWANGVTFDINTLTHAYQSLGMRVPWRYNKINCLRSIKTIYPDVYSMVEPLVRKETSHNALDDAICQAKILQAIGTRRGFELC